MARRGEETGRSPLAVEERRAVERLLGREVRLVEQGALVRAIGPDSPLLEDPRTGVRYRLKRHRDAPGAAGEERCLRAAARVPGVRVPRLVGRVGSLLLLEYVPGTTLYGMREAAGRGALGSPVEAGRWRAALAGLAALHSAQGPWVAELPRSFARPALAEWCRRNLRRIERSGLRRFRALGEPRSSAPVLPAPERIEAAMETLARHADAGPVHGDAHPGQVVFSGEADPVWLDWEKLCRGPAWFDLSRLLRDAPPELRPELEAAYAAERERLGAPFPPTSPELRRSCELLHGLRRLRRAVTGMRGRDAARFARLFDETCRELAEEGA